VPLARLPPHQGALVLTVHKSQGSQFPSVALVLADRASPIQTRELIYTGLTRAQQRFAWLGRREVLDEALQTRVQRASGLAELLQP
jgi:exodeoxyribonuclease V alpha subunit